MNIQKNGLSIHSVDDWFRLAPPKGGQKHWVAGRSAMECARAWCGSTEGPCVPDEIIALLGSSPELANLEFLHGTPEHQVRFDKLAGEPRNADMVVVASASLGKIAISIEAKADETFGDLVHDVLRAGVRKIAADQRTNSIARVQALADALLPSRTASTAPLGELRYQLLTAVAGAIAFAIEQKAAVAALLIHEFRTDKTTPENIERNSADLNVFVSRLTRGEIASVANGVIAGPIRVPGRPLFDTKVDLYVGKAARQVHV